MFKDYLASSKQNIEQWLGEVLNSPNQEFEQLYESMNYSLNARWQTNTTYFN